MNTHSPQQRPSLFYRPLKLMALTAALALAACGDGDPPPAFDSKPGLSLYAGALGGSGNIDGLPGRFSLGYGNGIALDTAGNIYVSDNNGSTIRRISPSGVVTTLAGQAGLNGSQDGTGPQARFGYAGSADITGMAVDGAGSVYVADVDNNTIRKITPDGVVTTLAGTAGKCGATDGPLSLALFCRPQGLALDMAGTLYVADNSQLIRKITPDGMVTTLAGHLDSGIRVATDGAGAAAGFGTVAGLAVNALGEVLAVDWGAIRKITAAGVVTTLAGTAGVRGSADGVGPAASFSNARGIAIDGAGNAFIADSLNFTIRKITPSGVVSTLAGQAMSAGGYQDGGGQVARFHHPVALAVNNSGALVVTDSFNHVIRGISQSGTVSTLAGMARPRWPALPPMHRTSMEALTIWTRSAA